MDPAQLQALEGLVDRLGAAVGTAVSTNLAATLTAERAATQTDIVRAVSHSGRRARSRSAIHAQDRDSQSDHEGSEQCC